MKRTLIFATLLAACCSFGCRPHLGFSPFRGSVVGVSIPVGHVHSAHCGHYWADDGWHHSHGHVHGHGCGHVYYGGRWVLHRAVHIAHGHSCHGHCSHYRHHGRWYLLPRHRHGPGCGHRLRGGIWIIGN